LSEGDAPSGPDMDSAILKKANDFGAAVRRLRFQAKLTLRDLAATSGLASSTISKVENGLMSPTYDNILRLAAGLGVDVEELFNPQSEQMATGRRSVTRARQGTQLESRNYNYEILCTDLSQKKFVPIVATLPKLSVSNATELVRHDGDEFVYVLSGKVAILTDIYEPLYLEVGDSCYFDSSMGHTLVAAGDTDAVILWVASSLEAKGIIDHRHRLAGQ
jgi:transcriptional regulator with XRE-family HTH domain